MSFLSHYFNENNCRLNNHFEGKGLIHYGCELSSAIVQVPLTAQMEGLVELIKEL